MNIDRVKLNLSKNGVFVSNLITYGLKYKNLLNHYKLVKENSKGQTFSKLDSPYEYLKQLIENNPSLRDVCSMTQYRDITYGEMLEEIGNLSKYMHAVINCQKGDKISICAESSIEGLIAFFAMNKLGLANARIFNGSKDDKLKKNIIDFDSNTIMIDSGNIETLSNIIDETKIKNVIVMDEIESVIINNFKEKHQNVNIVKWNEVQEIGSKIEEDYQEKVSFTDLAAILYTSGSSGDPKPISISNRVYVNMVDVVCNTTDIKKCDGERVVGVVSHEYPYAAINSTVMILLMGKTLIIPTTNEKGMDFNALLSKKPDRIQAIPNFYKLLDVAKQNGELETDNLSGLTTIISGGENYTKSEKLNTLKFLSSENSNSLLIDGFGFGELGSATALKFGMSEYFLLMNGLEAKVIDPKTMKTLPNNKEGKLCFTGPTISDGYYNNEKATKENYIRDENGKLWFVSDTYGFVHGAFNRLFKPTGREREYFITSDGKGSFVKVYSGNVENAIIASGCIEDCVVVQSDLSAMPTPVAYISLRTDCNMTKDEINELIRLKCQALEDFSQPTDIRYEEKIERTPAGKKNYVYYKNKSTNIK